MITIMSRTDMSSDLRDLFAAPRVAAPRVAAPPVDAPSIAPPSTAPPPVPSNAVYTERKPRKPARSAHSYSSSESSVRYVPDFEPEPYDGTCGEYTTLAEISKTRGCRMVQSDSDSELSSLPGSRVQVFDEEDHNTAYTALDEPAASVEKVKPPRKPSKKREKPCLIPLQQEEY